MNENDTITEAEYTETPAGTASEKTSESPSKKMVLLKRRTPIDPDQQNVESSKQWIKPALWVVLIFITLTLVLLYIRGAQISAGV